MLILSPPKPVHVAEASTSQVHPMPLLGGLVLGSPLKGPFLTLLMTFLNGTCFERVYIPKS